MKALLAWLVSLVCVYASAQPAIEWQKSLGGSGGDEAYAIQQTSDGGYIVAGHSSSNDGDVTGNHGYDDYWVVKLDVSGNIQWQKSLGGSGADMAVSIGQTSDGGYIVAGLSLSNDGDVTANHGSSDFWVVKLDVSGNIQWQKSLGGSGSDWALSIKQTSDGACIVAGHIMSNDGDVSGNHGASDYWVVKLGADPIPSFVSVDNIISLNSSFSQPKQIWSGFSTGSSTPLKVCADGSRSTRFTYANNDSTVATGNIRARIRSDTLGTQAMTLGEFVEPFTVGNVATFWYNHPDYVPSTYGFFREDTVQIYDASTNRILAQIKLHIYRAPVVFIHGLWGSDKSFEEMQSAFELNSHRSALMHRINYKPYSLLPLADNRYRVRAAIQEVFEQVRDVNISAGRADVLAHSMGGLLARIYLQENYNTLYRGDMHRLITLNTPHSGSHLADFMIGNSGNSIQCLIYGYIWKPLGFLCDIAHESAIGDMRVNSSAIDDVLNHPDALIRNTVPSYSVESDWGLLGCSNVELLIPDFIFKGLSSDKVVATASQQGGLSRDTLVTDQCHLGSARNPDIIAKVQDLLSLPPTSAYFDLDGFDPEPLEFMAPPDDNPQGPGHRGGAVSFTSPAYGASFSPGDQLTIAATATGANRIVIAVGNVDIPIDVADTFAASLTYSYSIPQDAFGELRMVAIALDSNDVIAFDTTLIRITQVATLDSLETTPQGIAIDKADKGYVTILGHFSDSVTRVVTFSDLISYSTDTVGIVNPLGNGGFLAVDTGRVNVTITMQGRSVELPILVYYEPDLPDGVEVPTRASMLPSISVVPNPTSSEFRLVSEAVTDGVYHVGVVDMLGRVIAEDNVLFTGGQTEFLRFNLVAGLYSVIVSIDDMLLVGRMVIH